MKTNATLYLCRTLIGFPDAVGVFNNNLHYRITAILLAGENAQQGQAMKYYVLVGVFINSVTVAMKQQTTAPSTT
ncbi:hypothetical protein [uncultured Pontibacter sp.]|uniref:hypothetical protein n=1 Tax=uncultured Pontibacter sp. TaxID=453356 RepID=UPI002613A5AC|nr:hypothetical protein [uncultured Pontibacter sp.]